MCDNYPVDVSTNSRTALTALADKPDQSVEDENLTLQERVEIIVKQNLAAELDQMKSDMRVEMSLLKSILNT